MHQAVTTMKMTWTMCKMEDNEQSLNRWQSRCGLLEYLIKWLGAKQSVFAPATHAIGVDNVLFAWTIHFLRHTSKNVGSTFCPEWKFSQAGFLGYYVLQSYSVEDALLLYKVAIHISSKMYAIRSSVECKHSCFLCCRLICSMIWRGPCTWRSESGSMNWTMAQDRGQYGQTIRMCSASQSGFRVYVFSVRECNVA